MGINGPGTVSGRFFRILFTGFSLARSGLWSRPQIDANEVGLVAGEEPPVRECRVRSRRRLEDPGRAEAVEPLGVRRGERQLSALGEDPESIACEENRSGSESLLAPEHLAVFEADAAEIRPCFLAAMEAEESPSRATGVA